jgi:hypothetical protein
MIGPRQEGWKYLAAGGTGGLLYWLLTYPTDVIKVRVRTYVWCGVCTMVVWLTIRGAHSVEHASRCPGQAPAQVQKRRTLRKVARPATTLLSIRFELTSSWFVLRLLHVCVCVC